MLLAAARGQTSAHALVERVKDEVFEAHQTARSGIRGLLSVT